MTARILVVDDVPANLRLLEARLSAEYFDVMTATSGEEALAVCNRAECDLVLLDVMMPDVDGFEVCRRLKKNPSTQHIPVVMVTALDQPSDRVTGLDAGADDFLTKPVSDLVLIAKPGYAFASQGGAVSASVPSVTGAHGYPNTDTELDAIFIAAGPAIRPASTLDRVQNMDVAPTIAAILGIQMPAGIQGQVLRSILRN